MHVRERRVTGADCKSLAIGPTVFEIIDESGTMGPARLSLQGVRMARSSWLVLAAFSVLALAAGFVSPDASVYGRTAKAHTAAVAR